jgi:hypothetical protein
MLDLARFLEKSRQCAAVLSDTTKTSHRAVLEPEVSGHQNRRFSISTTAKESAKVFGTTFTVGGFSGGILWPEMVNLNLSVGTLLLAAYGLSSCMWMDHRTSAGLKRRSWKIEIRAGPYGVPGATRQSSAPSTASLRLSTWAAVRPCGTPLRGGIGSQWWTSHPRRFLPQSGTPLARSGRRSSCVASIWRASHRDGHHRASPRSIVHFRPAPLSVRGGRSSS